MRLLAANKPSWLLLRMNLLWHLSMTKQLLLRYKITTLFVVLILAPNIGSIQALVLMPTLNIVSLSPTPFGLAFSMIGLQAVAIIWFYIQRSVFTNKPWQKYLKSLPINKQQNAFNEIGLLLLINFAFWIPLLLTASLQIKSYLPNLFLLICKVICCMILILQTQIICQKQRFYLLISILLSDTVWFYSSVSPVHSLQLPLLLSLITLNAIITLRLSELDRVKMQYRIHTAQPFKKCPLLRVQLYNLSQSRLSSVVMPLLNLVALMTILGYLAAKLNSHPNFIHFMLDGLLLAALICSGFFKKLHRQREHYFTFLQPLPITSKQWIWQDCLFVSAIWLSLYCSLISVICYFTTLSLLTIIGMLLIGESYLILCYYPQTRQPRYGILICGFLLGLFVTLNHFINWNYL